MENKKIHLLAASKNTRVYSDCLFLSFLIEIPTVYLAQLNTHRILSKSSISARAVPIPKYLERIGNSPYVPQFGKAQSGMKSGIIEDSNVVEKATDLWLDTMQTNINGATLLDNLDIHKEHANRLVAPFAYSTVIVSGTEWDNFFYLRCPKYELEGQVFRSKQELVKALPMYSIEDLNLFNTINKATAQPEIQSVAEAMYDIYCNAVKDISSVQKEFDLEDLYDKTWSMAFESLLSNRQGFTLEDSLACSSSKAARISFGNFKEEHLDKHRNRTQLLLRDKHMGVFEHQVRKMNQDEYFNFSKSFVIGKEDYDSRVQKSIDLYGTIENDYSWDLVQEKGGMYYIKEFGWCNNIRGFISYRFIIDNTLPLV